LETEILEPNPIIAANSRGSCKPKIPLRILFDLKDKIVWEPIGGGVIPEMINLPPEAGSP
jgi:hypothetical protein